MLRITGGELVDAPGGPVVNIGQIAKMAQQMQTQMAQAQAELRETTLEATAGGGAVRVVITGAQEVRLIEIDPSAVDPAEVEMLQDLVHGRGQRRDRAEQGARATSGWPVTGGLACRDAACPACRASLTYERFDAHRT